MSYTSNERWESRAFTKSWRKWARAEWLGRGRRKEIRGCGYFVPVGTTNHTDEKKGDKDEKKDDKGLWVFYLGWNHQSGPNAPNLFRLVAPIRTKGPCTSPANGQESNPFPSRSKANKFFSYSIPPHSKPNYPQPNPIHYVLGCDGAAPVGCHGY